MARRNIDNPAATPWRWAALGGLIGLLLTLLLFAPARWLAGGLDNATAGQLLLTDARGTVWNGTARLVLAGGVGSRDALALPGTVAWRLRPAWLGADAQVESSCCTARPLHMALRLQGAGTRLAVADGQSQWPAALLTGLGTPWNTLQPEGELALSTQGLSVEWHAGRMALAGRALLEARQMSSRLSTLKPMGSYRITLTGGPVATLQLETIDGALQLAGSGSWVGGRLRFQGEASAAPERESVLSNLLNIIGRRNGARSIITVG